MTYTVSELITEAYYESGIVSREFETVQGYQLNNGLKWLNQIIGDKVTDNGDLPYITVKYPLNCVPNQESYFIPNCIDIEAIVFYIGSVRYQMQYVDRIRYFGYPRADDISSLPLSYTYERCFGGINLYLYFPPQSAYDLFITGNFFMPVVSLNQDLQSKLTTANLGAPRKSGAGTLGIGQLVINDVDMVGNYATAQALATAITAAVDDVIASIINNQMVLSSTVGVTITIKTTGIQDPAGFITFASFSTIGGAFSQVFYFMALDQFYIDYIEYQLADRLCQKYNFEVPLGVREQLDSYRLQISKMAEPLDLFTQKISCLRASWAINYAAANIGKGFTTNGF